MGSNSTKKNKKKLTLCCGSGSSAQLIKKDTLPLLKNVALKDDTNGWNQVKNTILMKVFKELLEKTLIELFRQEEACRPYFNTLLFQGLCAWQLDCISPNQDDLSNLPAVEFLTDQEMMLHQEFDQYRQQYKQEKLNLEKQNFLEWESYCRGLIEREMRSQGLSIQLIVCNELFAMRWRNRVSATPVPENL